MRREQRRGGERPELGRALGPDERRERDRQSVHLLGLWISTRAKKNSFQAEMKVNIAVATRPGRSSGARC